MKYKDVMEEAKQEIDDENAKKLIKIVKTRKLEVERAEHIAKKLRKQFDAFLEEDVDEELLFGEDTNSWA